MIAKELVDEAACEDGLVGTVVNNDPSQDLEHAMLDEVPENLHVDITKEPEERCCNLEQHFVEKVFNTIIVNIVIGVEWSQRE